LLYVVFPLLISMALSLCVVSGSSAAGDTYTWEKSEEIMTSDDISSIAAVDSNHVWASVYHEGILFFNGSAWSVQLPPPAEQEFCINDIFAVDATHVWAAGINGAIYFYDGSAWKLQTSGSEADLYAIGGLDACHVWAVGDLYGNGQILFNDGTGWKTDYEVDDNEFYDVCPIDASNLWVAGHSTSMVFDGEKWKAAPEPDGGNIDALSAIDGDHIWAVAGDEEDDIFYPEDELYFFNGTKWSKCDLPARSVFSVFALNENDVWATGLDDCDYEGEDSAYFHYDGSAWKRIDEEDEFELYTIFALDSDHIWAGGLHERITFYDGNKWTATHSGIAKRMSDVAIGDANHAWAVGSGGTLLRFDGVKWDLEQDVVFEDLQAITAVGPNFACAVGDGGRVVTFNGVSWTKSVIDERMNMIAVDAVDPLHVWAIGRSRSSTEDTTNSIYFYDGTRWSRQYSSAELFVFDISASDECNVWAVGTGWGPNISGGQILFFDGITWKKQPVTEHAADINWDGGIITTVDALDANHVWAAGTTGPEVTDLTDTGSGFTLFFDGSKWKSEAGRYDCQFRDIKAIDPSHVFAVANYTCEDYDPSKVYLFDGSSWIEQADLDPVISGIAASDVNNILMAGYETYDNSLPERYFARPVIMCGNRHLGTTARNWAHDSMGTAISAQEWYLAEGCTGPGFETWVLVQNPNDVGARLNITYMTPDGPVAGPSEELPPNSRKTYNVAAHVPNTWEVSTKVQSDKPVVAERAEYGNNRAWAHDSIGTSETAHEWYLAEGCSAGGFETWILVQNPNDSAAHVNIAYLTPEGPVRGPSEVLLPNSRKTYNVAAHVPDNWEVSTKVTSDHPIVAERAEYGNSRAWAHDSIGTSKTSQQWYLAEGSTGPGFETWVLVENPNGEVAEVSVTYMTALGPVQGPKDIVLPYSRKTYNAAVHVPGEWEVSTKVESDIPIVAERAVYGNNRVWAHDSVGASEAAEEWYLAEGSTGPGFETWVLVENPNDEAANVEITYMTPQGPREGPTDELPPNSRKTYNVGLRVPGTWEVSTKVESDIPVVAERAQYGD